MYITYRAPLDREQQQSHAKCVTRDALCLGRRCGCVSAGRELRTVSACRELRNERVQLASFQGKDQCSRGGWRFNSQFSLEFDADEEKRRAPGRSKCD